MHRYSLRKSAFTYASQAEWGLVYKGQITVSAVDEYGRNQVDVLNEGDIWYFPKYAIDDSFVMEYY